MLASAVRDYVVNYGVSPGDRTVVVTNNDDAYRTAIALKDAGLEVPAILDARARGRRRAAAGGARLGIRVETGQGHRQGQGRQAGDRRRICAQAARAPCWKRSPATRWPCRAAGRRWCTCGPIAAASWSGTRRGRCSAPTRGRRPARWRAFRVIAPGAANGAFARWPSVLADAHAAGGGGQGRGHSPDRPPRPKGERRGRGPARAGLAHAAGRRARAAQPRCGSTTRTT
jgi:sarcosine oxidase subunit alpha